MATPSTVPIDHKAGSQPSEWTLSLSRVGMTASSFVNRTTVPVCFRTTTPGRQNGFVGRRPGRDFVIPAIPVWSSRRRAVALQKGLVCEKPWSEKALFRKRLGRHSPRLRRKSGVCYTAGEISRF